MFSFFEFTRVCHMKYEVIESDVVRNQQFKMLLSSFSLTCAS